jgi:ATP-dependent RNA helicase DeaD
MKSASFVLGKQITSLLEAQGITVATPVQEEIIPAIANGQDVLAQSETGSGKTLSFAIPIIEKLQRSDGLRALVLVPTRELCTQVTGEFVKYSSGKRLGIVPVYGGVPINTQASRLRSANIVVATPGRLIDLMNRNTVKLSSIKYFVCDEADRMLDMGFIRDVEKIARQLPPEHQTMLFSATVSKEIEKLAEKYLRNPKNVRLASTVKPIFLRQTYCTVSPERKMNLLAGLLKEERNLAIVFCNRKHITTKLAKKLSGAGINARCLNGNMSQPQRERVTNEFRQKKFTVLVATDVAARGLDIDNVSHVYNYEIPKDVESYTHRVGRTARAGKKGEAISLVATEDEKKFFQQILFRYRGEISLRDNGEVVSPLVKVGSAKPEHNERKPGATWKKRWQRVMNHEGKRQ